MEHFLSMDTPERIDQDAEHVGYILETTDGWEAFALIRRYETRDEAIAAIEQADLPVC